jgi:hypothetical protein
MLTRRTQIFLGFDTISGLERVDPADEAAVAALAR